jgi:hypothetical protein
MVVSPSFGGSSGLHPENVLLVNMAVGFLVFSVRQEHAHAIFYSYGQCYGYAMIITDPTTKKRRGEKIVFWP